MGLIVELDPISLGLTAEQDPISLGLATKKIGCDWEARLNIIESNKSFGSGYPVRPKNIWSSDKVSPNILGSDCGAEVGLNILKPGEQGN
jgi:hypothetical protein